MPEGLAEVLDCDVVLQPWPLEELLLYDFPTKWREADNHSQFDYCDVYQ
jgi:hypothetical protein